MQGEDFSGSITENVAAVAKKVQERNEQFLFSEVRAESQNASAPKENHILCAKGLQCIDALDLFITAPLGLEDPALDVVLEQNQFRREAIRSNAEKRKTFENGERRARRN